MSRFRTLVAASALALVAAAPLANAQAVDIGGTSLELGASRADTLAVANAQFELSPTSTRDQYTLYPKRAPGAASDAPYPKAIGTITIDNDQLERVTRNLGSFRTPNAEQAIDNMITAFANAPNSGDRPAVQTDTGLAGDASTSRVYFSYPDRAIQIVVYRPADRAGQATIDITEQYTLRGGEAPMATTPR